MHDGEDATRAADLDGPVRGRERERPTPEQAAVLDDEGAVVQDEVHRAAQLLGHPPGGGMAPARHEHDLHSPRTRRVHGPAGARREVLVAAKQRPVDVEGEEAEAHSLVSNAQSPVQTSTRSITSPGRIRSTTSMPLATRPKSV